MLSFNLPYTNYSVTRLSKRPWVHKTAEFDWSAPSKERPHIRLLLSVTVRMSSTTRISWGEILGVYTWPALEPDRYIGPYQTGRPCLSSLAWICSIVVWWWFGAVLFRPGPGPVIKIWPGVYSWWCSILFLITVKISLELELDRYTGPDRPPVLVLSSHW